MTFKHLLRLFRCLLVSQSIGAICGFLAVTPFSDFVVGKILFFQIIAFFVGFTCWLAEASDPNARRFLTPAERTKRIELLRSKIRARHQAKARAQLQLKAPYEQRLANYLKVDTDQLNEPYDQSNQPYWQAMEFTERTSPKSIGRIRSLLIRILSALRFQKPILKP